MQTMAELWRSSLRRFGGQIALVHDGQQRTYRDLVDRGRRLAGGLHGLGVRHQDRVSMLAMNRAEWFDYYCAAETSGFIAATVNFRLAVPEFAYILKDSAPRVLIFEDQYAEAVAGLRGQLPDIETYVCIGRNRPDWALDYDTVLAGGDPGIVTTEPDREDIVRLLYTSGTTGRPKGVARSHRGDLNVAISIANAMGFTEASRQLLCMPMFHLGAQIMGAAANWAGGSNYLERAFDPPGLLRAVGRDRISHLHLAPVMVQQVIDQPDVKAHDVSTLKGICYSAAPMPLTIMQRCLDLFGDVDFVNLYGGTESGAGSVMTAHQHRLFASTKRLASVGQAGQYTEIRVVDDQERDCPPGQPGEILIRGETVMSYYWNNSPATVEALRGGWYRTGDMAYTDEDGFLFLVDRKKDMIISGGENIYCREVEEALMAHAGVGDAAVIGVADAKWGEAVKAVVIRKPGAAVTEEELIEHCSTLIARYKRPKSIDFVTELPRLPSGKVHKPTLRERYR
jgi:acyl-CoA synthetase (AMP-forming)/AMP-acid ligase II